MPAVIRHELSHVFLLVSIVINICVYNYITCYYIDDEIDLAGMLILLSALLMMENLRIHFVDVLASPRNFVCGLLSISAIGQLIMVGWWALCFIISKAFWGGMTLQFVEYLFDKRSSTYIHLLFYGTDIIKLILALYAFFDTCQTHRLQRAEAEAQAEAPLNYEFLFDD